MKYFYSRTKCAFACVCVCGGGVFPTRRTWGGNRWHSPTSPLSLLTWSFRSRWAGHLTLTRESRKYFLFVRHHSVSCHHEKKVSKREVSIDLAWRLRNLFTLFLQLVSDKKIRIVFHIKFNLFRNKWKILDFSSILTSFLRQFGFYKHIFH